MQRSRCRYSRRRHHLLQLRLRLTDHQLHPHRHQAMGVVVLVLAQHHQAQVLRARRMTCRQVVIAMAAAVRRAGLAVALRWRKQWRLQQPHHHHQVLARAAVGVAGGVRRPLPHCLIERQQHQHLHRQH